ncbi:hypothetical protein M0802_010720 [Mischocyttarus mexicanus]|nr:hypothetical protein M0802_010720 [Mischocyttarus mexicanus]
MDKCLKQIIRISWARRSRGLFLNCNKISRTNHNVSQNYWTQTTEVYNSIKLEPIKRIMDETSVMTSNDSKRILDSVVMNQYQKLNLDDIFNILAVMVQVTKSEKKRFHLKEHSGFQVLCSHIQKQIRAMKISEVLEAIKLLNFLNISSNATLMQNLLQIIRNEINKLDINQVHLLITILQNMEPTPLSSALLIALPMLLTNILKTKLDYSDLKELSLVLNYSKYINEKELINDVYKHIQFILENDNKFISTHTLKNIFLRIHADQTPLNKENTKTIQSVREALFHNINELTISDIQKCISEISRCIINKNLYMSYCYDATFINELLNVAINKNADFITCCNIGKKLNNISFIHLPFIEFLIAKLSRKDIIKQLNPLNLIEILQISSNAEYQSIPWLILENEILDPNFFNDYSVTILLKCNVHLAVFNKFYPKLLDEVFTKINRKLLNYNFGQNIFTKRFLLLHQSVKSFYPRYGGFWSDEAINNLIDRQMNNKYCNQISIHLERTMGGPQYVIRNLKTKLGHKINYAVIMRKGGYPIAFNTNNSKILANFTGYVEDLSCESNNVVILIIEYLPISYSINTKELLGVWKLQLKCIETLTGHKCVPININEWWSLPEHEKNMYIMKEIKDNCSDALQIT